MAQNRTIGKPEMREMLLLLSVVIPFYRVEKYIGACLAALEGLEECEALLVDDCGDDQSADIAQAYCAAHPFARVIRREKNGGLSAARNTGLSAAKGEYVYFLDSDDIPNAQALLRVTKRAEAQKLDVAKARFCYLDDETGELSDGAAISPTEIMSGGELFAAQCAEGVYEPMVWQCVYRHAFLDEIGLRMADGLLFEDELFQAPALLKAKRTQAFEDVLLQYRQRQGSIMASFARSSKWCESYLQVCRKLDELAPDAGGRRGKTRTEKANWSNRAQRREEYPRISSAAAVAPGSDGVFEKESAGIGRVCAAQRRCRSLRRRAFC